MDEASGRAFVVQAGAPVAEVDLRRLSVRYHELAEPMSLLRRLRDWLEPKAEAKAMEGPERRAVWLGDGRLAVTGVDYQASVDGQGREQELDRPAGLKLIDTRTWSVRTLDRTTSSVTLAGGVLFACGTSWDSRSSKIGGSGLTAYDASGVAAGVRFDRFLSFRPAAPGRRTWAARRSWRACRRARSSRSRASRTRGSWAGSRWASAATAVSVRWSSCGR